MGDRLTRARRSALLSRDDYLATWSGLHGGYDPSSSIAVRTWLSVAYRAARPLASLGIQPDLVTLGGLLAAGAAAFSASRHGSGWLAVAALLAACCGILDGLDGAVAVLSGRTTAFGQVLDSVVDRGGDLLFLLALHGAGAPLSWCAWAGAATLMLEYLRARAAVAGMTEIGVVTVWERPSRVVVTALFLAAASTTSLIGTASGAHTWAKAATYIWLGLGIVGFVQLTVVVRRRLR